GDAVLQLTEQHLALMQQYAALEMRRHVRGDAALQLDRAAEDAGEPGKKILVLLVKAPCLIAVDLENAPRGSLDRDRHVDQRNDAVRAQQVGVAVLLASRQIVDIDRRAGAEGAAGGRGHVGGKARMPDDAVVPADTGADEKV